MTWTGTLVSLKGVRRKASTKLRFVKRKWFSGSPYLEDVLRAAAKLEPPRRVIYYPLGTAEFENYEEVTYSELYYEACRCAGMIRTLEGFREGAPILIHVEDHWDAILWFWAAYLADGIPVLSPALSNVDEHRRSHLAALADVLEQPLCITRDKFLWFFEGDDNIEGGYGFNNYTIEWILTDDPCPSSPSSPRSPMRRPYPLTPRSLSSKSSMSSVDSIDKGRHRYERRHRKNLRNPGDGLAMLLLTSGSTGAPKAVRLTHSQVLAAAAGKADVRKLPKDKAFLNWVGLDHVAGLVEIHIQALCLGVDQVHVQPADIVSKPTTLMHLMSRHQVSRSFAPNFLLAKLAAHGIGPGAAWQARKWDLSNLTVLASGGEANDVSVCAAATELLALYGAPRNVITPGFGMTETCAGAIFNTDCPGYDEAKGLEFTSVGRCMKGMQMRITLPTDDGSVVLAEPSQAANLEVRGDVVFQGYYRNREANMQAFTPDGWFRTGDQGLIDEAGNLCLMGRTKDFVNVNGIKVSPAKVQQSVVWELDGLVNRVVAFPSRAAKAHTEQITVAYVPKKWPEDPATMAAINDRATRGCLMCCSCRPVVFPVAFESLVPLSTLGKVSNAKIRSLFEEGFFEEFVKIHDRAVAEYRANAFVPPRNAAEALLIKDFAAVMDVDIGVIGAESPVYDLGFTSMDLIRLKRHLDFRHGVDIPVLTLMQNPTARFLAPAIRQLTSPPVQGPAVKTTAKYEPVVALQPRGRKTPLWLIHPGVGEVLVFVGLAKHLANDDRPVYALRARGFEPGETHFKDIDDAVQSYLAAIKERQPEGPYAIAGYSYGTMLAFEVAKRLNAENGPSAVQFLGSFNLPPHIKPRMRQLNWNMCILHLSFFLGLTTEDYADSAEGAFRNAPRDEALRKVLAVADTERLAELQLDEKKLVAWADLAFGLQGMAVDYEPSGQVSTMDVFHAHPLRVAAKDREDWVQNHLAKWNDFCDEDVRFHEVGGAHYTMLGPDYVEGFANTLKEALRGRGL